MTAPLVDPFGRVIDYLRLSVTDRCDFRCVYCMAEAMTFLPRAQILTLEELEFIATTFIELGVKRLRITGGEPLIRHNLMQLVTALGRHAEQCELSLTTNASRLAQFAPDLKGAGVKRLNISLDSLRPERFRELTRTGDLAPVLQGIAAAMTQGFERIRLNAVVLKGRNDDEVVPLLEFALAHGLDIAYIEEMPLGLVDEHDRAITFCSSQELRDLIAACYPLEPSLARTGGPARYWQVPGYVSRIGFISPHSENFCASCNRVRLTAEGRLLLCLGNEHAVDLRAVVRRYPGDRAKLREAIIAALAIKPERHHFKLDREPQILRFMNATGG